MKFRELDPDTVERPDAGIASFTFQDDDDWFAVEIDIQHTGIFDVNFDVSSLSDNFRIAVN